MVSALWATAGATESLWVDELHSSWCVSAGLRDVAPRARAGNQSPLFFWLLFGLVRTLGNFSWISQEWLLRLPAITSFTLIAVFGLREVWREEGGQRGIGAMLVGLFAWLLLDRVQLFYASEARVYALVQLISLLAWLALWRTRTGQGWIWAWCALSVVLVFLHLTAILAVAAQICWGTLLVYRHACPSQHRLRWAGAVGIVLLASSAALLLSAPVWRARGQWGQFAGEASLQSFVGLLPLLAYAVPVGICRGIDWFSSRRLPTQRGAASGVRQIDWTRVAAEHVLSFRGLWWLATFGPWVAAWCITALDVAPVFHRRFVIVSAVPLILAASLEIGRLSRSLLRWSAVAGVAVWLIVSQGTLDNWLSGYWVGWQRWEGWRQATLVLGEQVQSGDGLWCASGLVEASTAQLPLDNALNRYLSFPLRGAYQVITEAGQRVEPRGLLSSGREWAEQLLTAPEPPAASRSIHWIVYRGSPAGFTQRLAAMRRSLAADAKASWRIDPPQAFGLVNIVRVTRAP